MQKAISDALSIPPKTIHFVLGYHNYSGKVTVFDSINDLYTLSFLPHYGQIFQHFHAIPLKQTLVEFKSSDDENH